MNLNNEVDVLKQIFNNLTDADKIAFLDSIKQPPHELERFRFDFITIKLEN